MLIDTGASDSFLRGQLIDRLALPTIGYHDVFGFGDTGPVLQYIADLEITLDEQYRLDDWRLMRLETPYRRVDGILGRDVLVLGRLTLDGPARTFTLEF